MSLPIVGCPLVCVRCAGCSGSRWPAVLCGRACSQALIGNQQREPAHSHHLGRMKPEGHSPPWTDPGTKGWMAEHPLQPPGACGGQAFFYLWVALVLAFSVTWHFHLSSPCCRSSELPWLCQHLPPTPGAAGTVTSSCAAWL